jgi:S-(hydroxymethyl)glutathione dehydrogenase/alcohol dehydrogenase
MQAAVLHDYDEGPRLEDVEVLGPEAGEVLVRLTASGVCGSDLHVLHGRSNAVTLPVVLGHEGAGVVEAVGAGVDSVRAGDPVVIALYGPCLACHNCLTGRIVHCNGPARVQAIFGKMADGSTRLRHDGVALHPMVGCGSLAEYAVVRETQVVAVPADVPLDVMCLAGCGVTTGLGAVFNIGQVAGGDTVAVVGCGGVGLNVVQGARIAGATTIVAVDTNPMKLDLASDLGATHVVDPRTAPIADAMPGIVPGGVDVAFEVVGSADLVVEALEVTRPGGTCVMVGSQPPGSTIPVKASVLFQERRLVGCVGGSNVPQRDIPRIVDLYRDGRLDLDRLVSQRLPLARFDEAFTALEAGEVARTVVTIDI